jgi:hypothetical protein
MSSIEPNKNRVILTQAFALVALSVALSAAANITRTGSIDTLPRGGIDAVTQAATPLEQISAAEQLFQSDWGAAAPDTYYKIAQAFDSDALNGADLMGVACRSSICKIFYEADTDIKIGQVLPRQLAYTFQSMVTVHAGKHEGREVFVYIDIPSPT